MQHLKRNIKQFAALDCPVTIYGETGVGKQLAARLIHDWSRRSTQRFMAIHCGSFSNDLLIEELFGIEEDTLPNSASSKSGITGIHSKGTILLNQIEDLSPRMQLSILKVIDRNKSVQHSSQNNPFDVRILAATHQDLTQLVEAGKFKEELYFRLNVAELVIPPLRERKDDIAPLCSYFLARFAKEFNKAVETISDKVMSLFMSYHFPGNIRELEHAIERAVILAEGGRLELRHFPERFHAAGEPAFENQGVFKTLAEMEKDYILETLTALGGNKSKTAEVLGISRAALWRKLKQFKIDDKG
jgi:two-component system response regulator AtoC